MKNWLVALLLSCLWLSWSQVRAEYEVIEHTIVDDGWVQIDLDFNFPFYGELFGTSFMFANGVVGFISPTDHSAGSGIVEDGLCCNAYDFTQTNNNYGQYGGVRFDYLIAPWHTDLIDHPNSQGVFKTQGGADYQSYFWENISEYYDATDLNTFSTTIEPLGSIAFNYTQVDIQSHSVSVFVTGDFSANEYEQWYYNHPSNGGVYWNSSDSTPIEIPETLSICEIAPDASLTCLYRPSTWAGAYYDQQCGISSLYDSGCTGYETAYYNQQCGLSALYDPNCTGYETAYFDNQCVLDPLYSPACTGWYYVEEEPIEEEVWEEEYGATDDDYEEIPVYETETNYSEVEIPSFDDLFDGSDTFAPTFETDYQEIEMSFDDIVIAEVEAEIEMFFAEMDIEMPEFDMPEMPEMDIEMEMPEIDMFDEPVEEEINEPTIEPEQEETETDQGVTNEEDTETSEETSQEEPIEDEPELEPEEEPVEEEVEEEVEETEPEEEEINEEESEEQEVEETEEEAEEERETEPEEKEVVMVAKVEPKKLTAKQKQTAREKKMREIITEKLKNLAVEVGEASSLKAQKELQAYIIALLNYKSGFSSYNSQLIDGDFYADRVIYDIRLPDSLRGRRIGLASELLHKQLVDIQWSEGYGRRQ